MAQLNSKQGICFITAPDTAGADKVFEHVRDISDYGPIAFPVKQFTVTNAHDIGCAVVSLLDDYKQHQHRYLLQLDAHGYIRPDKNFALRIHHFDICFNTLGDILAPLNIAYWNALILLLNACKGAHSIMDEGRVFRNINTPHVCRMLVSPKIDAYEMSLMHDYTTFYTQLLSPNNPTLIDCLDVDMVKRHKLVIFDFAAYTHYAAHQFLEMADNPTRLNNIREDWNLKAGVQSRLKKHTEFKATTRRNLYFLIIKMFCNKNFINLINLDAYKAQMEYDKFITTLKDDEIKYRQNYARRGEMKVDIDAIVKAYFNAPTSDLV